MSLELINILQTTPTHTFENILEIPDCLAIRYIIFTFDLILLSTMNHAKLKETPLFSFILDRLSSDVKLAVKSDFNFNEIRYDAETHVNASLEFVSWAQVLVDKYEHEQTRKQQMTVTYKVQRNNQIFSESNPKLTINFGNANIDKKNHFGRFTIQNFNYAILDESGKELNSSMKKNVQRQQLGAKDPNFLTQKKPSQIQIPTLQNYNEQGGSFPVVYLNELNNLKSDSSVDSLNLLISNLQPYNATNTTSKPDHMFICHDMKSGYAQDYKFSNNLLYRRSNSYRFNYLWHTSVFNYFSHKTISIPPKHWRQLCKKYQVKCIGTFIVQEMRVSESYYLTKEFALKLVYLAKKHKFDGYLLNIESQVNEVEKLKDWLKFLTQKIHEEIPGSMISWYDSIDDKGVVNYQNSVDDLNKIYYELTDTFFTNYWWNDDKLKEDLKFAKKDKTIYVGNDLWGRGTFGGGEFFTFKGIDEIQKFNKPNEPNLVPALFAPGYTYETGGQNSNAYFKANEDRLYRGVLFEKFDIEKWEPIDESLLESLLLNKQKQWHVRYFSQSLWTFKANKEMRVNFLFRIKQNITTNPEIKSLDYKIIVRVRDTSENKIVEPGTTLQQSEVPLSKTNIIRYVETLISGDNITPKSVLEIIVATTLEKVFDHESRLVSMYDKAMDWVQNVPMTNVNFIQPYNTYFNLGHGEKFFFKGDPFQESYDYLADYDIPQTLAINHPFKTSFEHHDSYIGGSSLILNQETINLFQIGMPSTQFNYPISYEAKVVSKGGPIDTLHFSQSSGFSIFLDKTSQNKLTNGWVEETFELTKENIKIMKKKFFKQLETILSVTVKSKCLLGQVNLRPKMIDQKQPERPKIQIIISQSFKTLSKDEIYISIKLNEKYLEQSLKTKRYLIKIDESYAAFIYLEKESQLYRGKLDQIPIKLKDGKSTIEVLEVDSEIKDQVLFSDDGLQLKQLKQMPLKHRIHLTNY